MVGSMVGSMAVAVVGGGGRYLVKLSESCVAPLSCAPRTSRTPIGLQRDITTQALTTARLFSLHTSLH